MVAAVAAVVAAVKIFTLAVVRIRDRVSLMMSSMTSKAAGVKFASG